MANQFHSRKKFQQKLVVSFSFFGLLVAACSPSVQPVASNPTLGVNNRSLSQRQGVDYGRAVQAVAPQITEKNYVNTNYKKYLNEALMSLNKINTSSSQSALNLTSPQVIARAKELVEREAVDYTHFKYIADRSFSIKWTTLRPGSLFYGGSYGTGWIVDRFKNPDGSWSNDFLVSTNIHVINTISSGGSSIGVENPYANFPADVYELGINNQVYDLENPDSNWMYPSSFAKLPNWNPQNYFTPQRRALVNQIKNKYQVNPYYSFAFSSTYWAWWNFENTIKLVADYYLAEDEVTADTNWYDAKKLYDDLMNTILDSEEYYNELFYNQANISEASPALLKSFYEKYKTKLDLEFIHDVANEIPNQTKTLDHGFLKVTIPDTVLAAKLPVFLDPSKYNEWTFPKFTQEDPFKNYSFHSYNSSFGFVGAQSRIYPLSDDQIEPIWHAGYPAEQTWNGLAYNSPGPVLKTSRGLITNAIFLNPSSKKNLDHNDCQIYNALCNDDGVQPATYSLGSNRSDTGGGSSGSMALNKNYEVQGIYWGVQFNFGSLLNYNSLGLYEPMYSSQNLNLPTFERIPGLAPENLGALAYLPDVDGKDPKAAKPFEQLLRSYLTTGLKQVFIAAKTDETYSKILSFDKLKSFDYSTNLEEQIKKVMGALTNSNPSDLATTSFTTLTNSNVNNLSEELLKDRLYTAIKSYWTNFFQETTTATEGYKMTFAKSFKIIPDLLVRTIHLIQQANALNPAATAINFTGFVKRDLGTVNMAADLQKYFQENNYKSHVYNNPANPLKIVDVNVKT